MPYSLEIFLVYCINISSVSSMAFDPKILGIKNIRLGSLNKLEVHLNYKLLSLG